MKIFLCCSKAHYPHIPPIKEQLEAIGHIVTLPNSYDNPTKEFEMKDLWPKEHQQRKSSMLRLQCKKIANNDAIIVFNMEKNGQENYIGWATFLEVFKAWELGKKIFFYNPLPTGMLYDELCAMDPVIIYWDLGLIL